MVFENYGGFYGVVSSEGGFLESSLRRFHCNARQNLLPRMLRHRIELHGFSSLLLILLLIDGWGRFMLGCVLVVYRCILVVFGCVALAPRHAPE